MAGTNLRFCDSECAYAHGANLLAEQELGEERIARDRAVDVAYL